MFDLFFVCVCVCVCVHKLCVTYKCIFQCTVGRDGYEVTTNKIVRPIEGCVLEHNILYHAVCYSCVSEFLCVTFTNYSMSILIRE